LRFGIFNTFVSFSIKLAASSADGWADPCNRKPRNPNAATLYQKTENRGQMTEYRLRMPVSDCMNSSFSQPFSSSFLHLPLSDVLLYALCPSLYALFARNPQPVQLVFLKLFQIRIIIQCVRIAQCVPVEHGLAFYDFFNRQLYLFHVERVRNIGRNQNLCRHMPR